LKKHRGLTWITTVIVLAVAGAIFWIITYGEAYWDNFEIKHLLSQAANKCYLDKSDDSVRDWTFRKLHEAFDTKVEDHGRIVTVMKIEADKDDLRIERSEVPPVVHIWFTYNRTVSIPLIGGTRTVQFVDHVEQDLSPVKW
jgi:hypothetical protein